MPKSAEDVLSILFLRFIGTVVPDLDAADRDLSILFLRFDTCRISAGFFFDTSRLSILFLRFAERS